MKETDLENIIRGLEELKQKQKEIQKEINNLEKTVQNEKNKKNSSTTHPEKPFHKNEP
jgi:cell division septum initiation protein DivIVA